MSWFWFWWLHLALMVVADFAWWTVAFRLTKRRLWRITISVFLGGQLVALVSALAGAGWPSHAPKIVFLMVLLWHYLALGVFLPLALVWSFAWVIRSVVRRRRCDSAPNPAFDNTLSRRDFLGAAAALAPPLLTFGIGGVALGQLGNLRVRRFTLAIPALPRPLEGLTIVQVTDIHLGELTRAGKLREIVDRSNALRPDLVVFTGDLIDYHLSDLPEAISAARAMEGRYGLWMVEGNHDVAEDEGEFRRRVKAAGLPLLLDESAVVPVRGYPVQILGLRWMFPNAMSLRERVPGIVLTRRAAPDRVVAAQLKLLLKQRQPEAFPILLSHHPHAFDAALAANLPLTLAGHTHGGQVMMNEEHGIGPIMFRYWSGLYTRGNSQLVVSNGAGTWLPLRVNAPAEIIHLTLRCG